MNRNIIASVGIALLLSAGVLYAAEERIVGKGAFDSYPAWLFDVGVMCCVCVAATLIIAMILKRHFRLVMADICRRESRLSEMEARFRVLTEAEYELQGKKNELERFTCNLSHGLKSRLITIRSYLCMVSYDMDAGHYARTTGHLNRVTDAVSEMTALVNDLLELSGDGRITITPSLPDAAFLRRDTREPEAESAENSPVSLLVPQKLIAIAGYRTRIAEVARTMIESAVKFREIRRFHTYRFKKSAAVGL